MNALTPRSLASRVAALALVAAVTAVVWLGAGAPLLDQYDDNAEAITGGLRQLGQFRSVIAQSRQAGVENRAGDLERYRGDFLDGPEDAIIVADLQTRLSAVIATRNGEVSSARALTPKNRDGLDYLGLGLQIRAEMKDIQDVLYAIETGTPLLFVERADLRLDERGTAAGRARNSESVAPMVLEVSVYGAKWPGSKPPDPPPAPNPKGPQASAKTVKAP